MNVVHAELSQAHVPGAEQACTAIAVVACYNQLFHYAPASPERMEFFILQGGALYTSWGKRTYALATEMVALVTPALPICLGDEFGGQLWVDNENGDDDNANMSLVQAFAKVVADKDAHCVLTIGAYSVALFRGGLELFDSHGDVATWRQFASQEDLFVHLRDKYPNPQMIYSLSVIKKRLFRPVQHFPIQGDAFKMADRLPPGFFYTFANDLGGETGAKEYLVAGLDDFLNYYNKLDPAHRHHYDMARTDRPLSLYLDLEFERFSGKNLEADGTAMRVALLRLIQEDEAAGDRQIQFHIYDSSKEKCGKKMRDKVSFHVHSHDMWFADAASMGAFLQHVEERALEELRVWREKGGEIVHEFFADQSVYTDNRCIRLPYSTKYGEARPFIPLDGATLLDALVSPPCLELYVALGRVPRSGSKKNSSVGNSGGGGSSMVSLSSAPQPIRALASAVEAQFKPERMGGGFRIETTGIVTFSMIKHDCDICGRVHGNQTYAVVDLKRRIFYLKCHADRKKKGEDIPFPASLDSLSFASATEMDDSGIFSVESSTARVVMAFARGVSSHGSRTFPPLPMSAPMELKNGEYTIRLPSNCPKDDGTFVMTVTQSNLTVRCNGKACSSGGKRWIRPSHSADDAGKWDLSFLFPFVGGEFSAQAFLAEPNLLVALGITSVDGVEHAEYEIKLKQAEEWGRQNQSLYVLRKCHVMSKILLDPSMEVCYRECLLVAPDFVYPISLIPRGPITLLMVLRQHQREGSLSFEGTPNLWSLACCSAKDKRYIGFRNVVYDLEQNVAHSWEDGGLFSLPPFKLFDQHFPVAILELAKQTCPNMNSEAVWVVADTPRFDMALGPKNVMWQYAQFGRLLHDDPDWPVNSLAAIFRSVNDNVLNADWLKHVMTEEECPLVLIKCNTAYWAMKRRTFMQAEEEENGLQRMDLEEDEEEIMNH